MIMHGTIFYRCSLICLNTRLWLIEGGQNSNRNSKFYKVDDWSLYQVIDQSLMEKKKKKREVIVSHNQILNLHLNLGRKQKQDNTCFQTN